MQGAFAADDLRIVCATNAFGRGIDRPDVETVVHVALPASLEAYYQEIGRAERDGRPATATLLWHYRDVKTRAFLVDHGREEANRSTVGLDAEERARRKALEHAKLRRMVAYAESAGCLRATMQRYFGDPATREPCGNCNRATPLDASSRLLVRKILSGIARAGDRHGGGRLWRCAGRPPPAKTPRLTRGGHGSTAAFLI